MDSVGSSVVYTMDVHSTDRDRGATSADRSCFAQFFAAEHERQVRRAYLMTGDADTAHDVVAAAFEQVYRRWAAIVEPGPYLQRCVLNGCRDVGRRRQRLVLASEPPESSLAGGTDEVELAMVVAQLPFRQRAALVLRFYGGLTEREIAAALGCRPGTVGPLISRGLARLRKEIR